MTTEMLWFIIGMAGVIISGLIIAMWQFAGSSFQSFISEVRGLRTDVQEALLVLGVVKEKQDTTDDKVDFHSIKLQDNEKWKADLFKDYRLHELKNK